MHWDLVPRPTSATRKWNAEKSPLPFLLHHVPAHSFSHPIPTDPLQNNDYFLRYFWLSHGFCMGWGMEHTDLEIILVSKADVFHTRSHSLALSLETVECPVSSYIPKGQYSCQQNQSLDFIVHLSFCSAHNHPQIYPPTEPETTFSMNQMNQKEKPERRQKISQK